MLRALEIREFLKGQQVVGFTASREVSDIPDEEFNKYLQELEGDVWVTGGCRGGDARIARLLAASRPNDLHVVILPANRNQVDEWWDSRYGVRVVLEEMPVGSSYADRNQMIVDISNRLVGFPELPEEHPRMKRSGTWQTIRMARKSLIPHDVFILREDYHG